MPVKFAAHIRLAEMRSLPSDQRRQVAEAREAKEKVFAERLLREVELTYEETLEPILQPPSLDLPSANSREATWMRTQLLAILGTEQVTTAAQEFLEDLKAREDIEPHERDFRSQLDRNGYAIDALSALQRIRQALRRGRPSDGVSAALSLIVRLTPYALEGFRHRQAIEKGADATRRYKKAAISLLQKILREKDPSLSARELWRLVGSRRYESLRVNVEEFNFLSDRNVLKISQMDEQGRNRDLKEVKFGSTFKAWCTEAKRTLKGGGRGDRPKRRG
jgi:hypothetical protein